MRIITSLAFVIAAVLFALLLHSWLRSRKGTGEDIARVFAALKGRNNNFWSFQYFPVIGSVIIVTAAAGFGIDWKNAAACAGGAVTAFLPLIAGSAAMPSGITSAYKEATNGDIRQSVRCGYRTGAVLGSYITAACLLGMCSLYLMLKDTAVIDIIASYALGAQITSVILHTSGEVYSSAYSMAVSSRDFTDRTGIFVGAGSDLASSYIASAAAAVLLAEVAVDTSGVTSTFTAEAAERFPLMVYAIGIAASIIGALFQRAGTLKKPSAGAEIGCIVSGIITIAGTYYLSNKMLQSAVYTWAAAAGIVCGIVLVVTCRLFSPDNKHFINAYNTDRSLGRYSSVIFNLGTGMISTAFCSFLILIAISVSYMYASFYGVAICAVGLSSVVGSVAAVSGLAVVSATASDIISSVKSQEATDIRKVMADALDTVSVRNGIAASTYTYFTGFAASLAVFSAFYYASGTQTYDIMDIRVLCGIIGGVAFAFVISGMLIGSVRITGRIALRDLGRSEDDTGASSSLRGAVLPAIIAVLFPTFVGLLFGVPALAGSVIASVVTGYMIITCINNSGMHFENSALKSVSSLLKMMAVFSVAFLPVFMRVGGLLFK